MRDLILLINHITKGTPKDLFNHFKQAFILLGFINVYYIIISILQEPLKILILISIDTVFALFYYKFYSTLDYFNLDFEIEDKEEDSVIKQENEPVDESPILPIIDEEIIKKSSTDQLFYFEDLLEETYKTGETKDIINTYMKRNEERNNRLC